ncbi:hypothetical protein [Denitromonas halophila]|uniref:Uncharacterized protein n=1 Tax=Denitromonas halophila TaxID=1629404 RepID=A0A557QXD0_9RHOO|nr:hypothetical protein [Denitromonas halophila]TVO57561.1 hypothetical protein FHP91_07745 [Denitromonas halophila]
MTTAERILAAIAGASSRQPRNAAEVRSGLGDVPAAQFDSAIAQLTAQRRLYSCSVTRSGTTALLIWPTDTVVPSGSWVSDSHSGLFAPRTPRRFPQAPQPHAMVPSPITPKPASKGASMNTTTFQTRMDAIRKHVAGRGGDNPIKLTEIAAALGIASSAATPMLTHALDRLVDAGVVCRAKRKPASGGRAGWLVWDATAKPAPVRADIAPQAKTQATAPATGDIALGDDVRLCLWDDATLVIESGGHRITVPAVTTRKITRFLVALEGVAQ